MVVVTVSVMVVAMSVMVVAVPVVPVTMPVTTLRGQINNVVLEYVILIDDGILVGSP